MGTPRKYFTVCGIETCGSTEALLDTGAADDSAIAGVRKRCRNTAVERDHHFYRTEIPVVYANHSKIT